MALSEADTCRKFVVPKLQEVGWDNEPHFIAGQRSISDGHEIIEFDNFTRHESNIARYPLSSTAPSTANCRGEPRP